MINNQEFPETELILRSFAEWLMIQNKSDNTTKTYVGVISQFLQWFQADVKEMETHHIQDYLDYLDCSNKSAGTIEKHFMAISVFSRFIDKPNLVFGIDRKAKSKEDERPESLGKLEQEALLKEVEADGHLRNVAIVYTLLHTGIRVSELCNLNYHDIQTDEDREYIAVRNSKGEIDREIPLSKVASKHIKVYKDSVKEDTEALFISSVKQRITPRSVQYMLNKFDVTPHKLRNTFCQNLVDKGIDIQTVSKLVGHRDLNMTKRYVKEPAQELALAIEHTFNGN